MPTIFLTFLYTNMYIFFKYWHRLNEPFGIYKIFLYVCTYMHNTPINNDLIGRFWNTNLVHDSFMTLSRPDALQHIFNITVFDPCYGVSIFP
jgi:hypothetical protein